MEEHGAHNPGVGSSNLPSAMEASFHDRRLAQRMQDPEFAKTFWAVRRSLGINGPDTPQAA